MNGQSAKRPGAPLRVPPAWSADTIGSITLAPSGLHPLPDMLTFLYYALMLLVGFFFYRHGQKLLNQGHRDDKGEPTQGMVGPMGFLVLGAAGSYLLFALLRALARGEVPCVGKGCAGQIYTLAEQAGPYWANVFFLAWCVVAFGYALYVTLKIWFRP
ncbi:hypothetical protein CLU86_1564 [Acidovorax sp. 62]|nr:hypothetical protein CLU86_1564 [Acidovorax sp. 62]